MVARQSVIAVTGLICVICNSLVFVFDRVDDQADEAYFWVKINCM